MDPSQWLDVAERTAVPGTRAPWARVFDRYRKNLQADDRSILLAEQLLDGASVNSPMPRVAARYADYFGPQDLPNSPYPLNRLGSFARLDRNYLPHWIDLDQFGRDLCSAVAHDSTSVSTNEIVEAIGVIGALSYSSEWVDDPETAYDLDVSASAASVLQVNGLMGPEVAAHLDRLGSRALHLLDVGVGRGNTLLPVLAELSNVGYTEVTVSLMDISGEQLAKAAERIGRKSGELGIRVRLAELIESNLHEMRVSLPARADTYDVVVSGGTIFHSTDKQRVFDWVHDSLRRTGLFIFWDWFAPCWAAPNLRVGMTPHYTSDDTFVATAEQAEAAVQTWGIGWFGPRGYFNYGSAVYATLVAALAERLAEFRQGETFAFLRWLSDVATSYPAPQPPAHYYCIEGYATSDVYESHMSRTGYTILGCYTQAQLRGRHGLEPQKLTGDGYDSSIRTYALQRQRDR